MKRILFATLLTLCTTGPAMAWSNHALASYRAFEGMPEVARAATVPAEPLESFLAAQAQPIAQLLAQQDAWANALPVGASLLIRGVWARMHTRLAAQ